MLTSSMGDSLTMLDMFVRGIAVGAMIVTAVSVCHRGISRHVQLATLLLGLSIIAWLITESAALWGAMGQFYPIIIPAYPVGALFWLFVVTVFEDRPITAANLWPTALLLTTGFLCEVIPLPEKDWLWVARNVFSGLLSLHAVVVIARGWVGDLVESRRRIRALVLGFAALFGALNVVLAFLSRLDPTGPWRLFTAGRPYGGAIFAAVIVATGVVFLQARPALFGVARRAGAGTDPRGEAAERRLMQELNEFMAADAWRREGLTIGHVAGQLGAPEHRLRRLINQRLGHRNFADFVNSYRIAAAKRRLADPREARTTVAAIAFDLGYGSLGPFNRAFRAATGEAPSEWRRQALQASPELSEAV